MEGQIGKTWRRMRQKMENTGNNQHESTHKNTPEKE
jgi:hypothetical protein